MNRRSFAKLMGLAALAPGRMRVESSPIHSMVGASRRTAPYDVRQFGAKGDAIADDGPAFTAALAAAALRGGVVLVPEGNYRTTRAIRLPSGVALQGEGRRSILSRVNGDPSVIASVFAKQIAVRDLAIVGNFSHGVFFDRSSDAEMIRCYVRGGTIPEYGYSGGVIIAGGARVTVEGCRFEGGGGPGYIQGSDIQCNGLGRTSSDIHILRNECLSTEVAVNIRCYDTSKSEVRGNDVRGARILGQMNHGYGILVYPTAPNPDSCFENVIVDNHVSYTQGSGIYVVRSPRSRVVGNVIDHVASVQTDYILPVAGVALNECDSTSVLGNTISNSGRVGISVSSAHSGIGRVDVRKNVITNAAGYGIHLRGILQDVHITGNDVSRTNGGIGGDTLDEQDDIEITDNILKNITGRGAIKLGNASKSIVARNTVRDADNYALDLSFRDDASTVAGNKVENAGTGWGKGGDVSRVMRKGKPQR